MTYLPVNKGGWPPDRVTALIVFWADGLSASQIADKLGGGITRSSVIGKVNRLGLPQRPQDEIRAHKEAHTSEYYYSRHCPRDPEKQQPLEIQEIGATPSSRLLTLTELEEATCRWPIGDPQEDDFRYCGADVADSHSSYCACHSRASLRFPI